MIVSYARDIPFHDFTYCGGVTEAFGKLLALNYGDVERGGI
jgi:hypothetical protein